MGCDGDQWWIGDDGRDVGIIVSVLVPAEEEMVPWWRYVLEMGGRIRSMGCCSLIVPGSLVLNIL